MAGRYDPLKMPVKDLAAENVSLLSTLLFFTNPRPSLYTRETDEEKLWLPMGDPKKKPKGLDSWTPRERKSNFKLVQDHTDIFGSENKREDWANEFWAKYQSTGNHGVVKCLPRKSTRIRSLRDTHTRYRKRMYQVNREVQIVMQKVYKKDAEKKLRKRKHVYQEVLSTEKTYVESLELFMKHYIDPMNGIAKPELQQSLKQAINTIIGINSPFLAMLEKCFVKTVDGEPVGIEEIFIRNAPVFKLYVQFVEKYGKILKMIKEEEKKNEQFKVFCTNVHSDLKKMAYRATTVKSFLIMPVQRLPRYKLLLGEVLKKTPKKDPRYGKIEEALKSVEGIADYINEKKKDIVTRMKATELYERFKLKDLVHSSRKLKLFTENCEINGIPNGEVFCFNDLLVIVSKGKLHRIEPEDSAARCFKPAETEEEELVEDDTLLIESERFECSMKFESNDQLEEFLSMITEILQVELGTKAEVREMFHGYLKKEGGGRISKGLKKRWHALSSDKKMRYYGKKGGKMKGSYPVENATFGVTTDRGYKSGFYVKTDQRIFYMKADDDESRMDWFTVLGIAGAKRE